MDVAPTDVGLSAQSSAIALIQHCVRTLFIRSSIGRRGVRCAVLSSCNWWFYQSKTDESGKEGEGGWWMLIISPPFLALFFSLEIFEILLGNDFFLILIQGSILRCNSPYFTHEAHTASPLLQHARTHARTHTPSLSKHRVCSPSFQSLAALFFCPTLFLFTDVPLASFFVSKKTQLNLPFSFLFFCVFIPFIIPSPIYECIPVSPVVSASSLLPFCVSVH